MRFHYRLTSIAALCLVLILSFTYIVIWAVRVVRIFGIHSGISITQEEVLHRHTDQTPDVRPQLIPKIIHHIFHNWHDPGNNTLPQDWEATRQTCIALNPGWEYRLWTEDVSRDFIGKEYPWFLGTYDGYRLPVQRVDTLKYFLMRHYGGLYLDLDNGCVEELTPLLYFPNWVTDGGHGALSNNILGSQPNHPYWILVTESLASYNWNYPFPYMTVSYASGQWFETALWEDYYHQLSQKGTEAAEKGQLLRVMMDMRPGSARWVFFSQGRGGSWDRWDNHLFGWIGSHLPKVALGVSILLCFLAFGCWGCIRWKTRRNRDYSLLATESGDGTVD